MNDNGYNWTNQVLTSGMQRKEHSTWQDIEEEYYIKCRKLFSNDISDWEWNVFKAQQLCVFI